MNFGIAFLILAIIWIGGCSILWKKMNDMKYFLLCAGFFSLGMACAYYIL